jgi:hypothetical protein
MSTQSIPSQPVFSIPDMKTIRNLAIGGLTGLLIWEVFARVVTKAVLGEPLEPAGLIDAIFNHQFGVSVNIWLREALHYGVGILGYPIAFYVISKNVPRWSAILDAIVFGTFTAAVTFYVMTASLPLGLGAFWLAVVIVIASRFVNRDEGLVKAISWGTFTWFNALGIMAPLGGLSFYLLDERVDLSFMSFVGHVIYGAVAVIVYERLQKRDIAA